MIDYFKISTLYTTINFAIKGKSARPKKLFNTNCALRLLADCLNDFGNQWR